MIIKMAKAVTSRDLPYFAWSGLRAFQNVSNVENAIFELHNVSPKHKNNVTKQARQIRHCLIQAHEYYKAAQKVTLATKPNLLYYSAMSLALAELLLKQTGDASLDRAREQHRHHGLTLSVSETKIDNLADQAATLVAKPVIINGERIGTFEQWHKSARETPLAGKLTEINPLGASMERFQAVATPKDEQLNSIPEQGISLLSCLKAIPDMTDFLVSNQITPDIVRGRIALQHVIPQGGQVASTFVCIIHPGATDKITAMLENWLCHPSEVNRIEYNDLGNGGILTVRSDPVSDPLDMSIPSAAMWNSEEIRFWRRCPAEC